MKRYSLLILLGSIMMFLLVGCAPSSPGALALTSSGLVLELKTFPNPPVPMRATEIQARLTNASGNPIPKAAITLDLSNPDSTTQASSLKLTDSGNGYYLSPVIFTTAGEWEITVSVSIQDQKESFHFTINTK
jgi:hypothetical protein